MGLGTRIGDSITHPVDRVLHELEQDGADQFLIEHSAPLLRIVCPIFEQFPLDMQIMALSCIYAMICATVEGETSQIEVESGVLIGFEDRLRMHIAEIRAVYKTAYGFRSHPDCPNPMKRM